MLRDHTHFATALLVAAVLNGCANNGSSGADTSEEKQYVTGSNIPSDPNKTNAKTVNGEQVEQGRPAAVMPRPHAGSGN